MKSTTKKSHAVLSFTCELPVITLEILKVIIYIKQKQKAHKFDILQ